MLLLLATVVVPNALAIAAAADTCPTRSGYWFTYDVPDFPSRGPITAFAIDAFRPNKMYATDGTDVVRTTNGGCNWETVYSVAGKTPLDHGFRGEAATIRSIEVPRNPAAGDTVLLLIAEQAGATTRPHVVRSIDTGKTWTAAVGLPPAGDPESIAISPAAPAIGYLGIDVGGGGLDLLFATEDGGARWLPRSDLTDLQPNRGIEKLALDPLVPTEVWAYGAGGLFRSRNGGATFTSVQDFDGSQVGEVEVFHSASRGFPQVFAFRRNDADMWVSTDDGETWPRVDTPGVVPSAAYGRTPQELLISARGRIHFFDAATSDWIEVRTPRPGIAGLVSDLGFEVDFYGHTAGTIERYDGPMSRFVQPDVPGGPDLEVGPFAEPVPEDPAPPALGPAGTKLRMKTGAKRTVGYELRLSGRDTDLDVFFLLDTSDTMSGTIQGMVDSVHGIIGKLHAAGLEPHFGIGVSRAYTDTLTPRGECQSETEQNCERNFIYRRLVNLSDFSNADQLRDALLSLQAEGGGRFDSQLGALWAIATGREIDDGPPGLQPSDVPAGQGAAFRKRGVHLIFVATDEPFATGEEGARDFTVSDFGRIEPPDIPSYGEVAGAMHAVDAKVLGLAIGQTPKTGRDSVTGGGPTALASMQEIARLTGAVAPAGGVDCDGDGVVDLAEGMELVCPVRRHNVDHGENLAQAITKLVEAEIGTRDIELEVVRGEDVVAGVTPRVYPDVVNQRDNLLDFEVTYRCPDRLQGETVRVELAATGPAGTLDAVTTTVSCLEEKVVEPVLPLDPVIALGLVLPPVLPPAPPPIAANAPSAQGQAQSQTQAQAQGAMAHQEQEQPQLAYVGATLDHREAYEAEEAMSDYRRRRSEVPQWATLGAGAVMMSLAYGWLTVSRQRVRVQRVRRWR